MILAARADTCTGHCHPGLTCLAADTGLTERSVRNGIAILVEKGFVSRQVKGCQGTIYAVLMPGLPLPNVEPGAAFKADNVEPGATFVPDAPLNVEPGAGLAAQDLGNVEPGAGLAAQDLGNVEPGATKLEERKKEGREPPVVPPSTSAGASPPAPLSDKRDDKGCRLPEDWQPSADDREFARSVGLNPETVAAEFRAYWLSVPGAKGRKAGRRGWSLTFQNRCRDRAVRQQPRAGPQPRETREQERRRKLGIVSSLDWLDGTPPLDLGGTDGPNPATTYPRLVG